MPVVTPQPGAYLHGVAKRLVWEYRRRPAAVALLPDVPAPERIAEETLEARLRCLDRCLVTLPPEGRLLLI